MYCLIMQRCSFALLLLAATTLAAPIGRTSAPWEELYPSITTNSPTSNAGVTAREAELGSGATPPAAIIAAEPEATTSAESTISPTPTVHTATGLPAEGEAVLVTFTSESPHGRYDCTLTSPVQQAQAKASFRKGLSLVIDELQDRYLYDLIDNPTTCPDRSYVLSFFNYARHPHLNDTASNAQTLANSIGKINGYADLVQVALNDRSDMALNANYTMQALHDILKGTVQDLYTLLSPSYCADCVPTQTSPEQCIAIPHLGTTQFFQETCNLVSYVSQTISFELRVIEYLTEKWLGEVGSLPDTDSWLSTHVHEDSPAYDLL